MSFRFVFFLVASLLTFQASGDGVKVGINLSPVNHYSSDFPLIDLNSRAGEWTLKKTNGDPLPGETFPGFTDQNIPFLGPDQIAQVTLISEGWGLTEGRYVATWEGTGVMSFHGVAVSQQQSNRVVMDAGDVEKIFMKILYHDPSDEIRNFRITREEFEMSSQVFHPRFLRTWSNYHLRFMQWQNTNHVYGKCIASGSACVLDQVDPDRPWFEGCPSGDSCKIFWANRSKPTDFSQGTTNGVSIERIIQLSNLVQKDAWFSVPHLAGDHYVREMARLIRDNLDSRLKVYIEHSNEVWNYGFSQTISAIQRGQSLGGTETEKIARYHGRRSKQIFEIFEQEFGGLDRIVRVMSSQAASPYKALLSLMQDNAFEKTDAVAIAPYFCDDAESAYSLGQISPLSVETILRFCRQRISVSVERVESYRDTVTGPFGLKLIAYEGGQHLVADGPLSSILTPLFIEANQSAKMGAAMGEYLEAVSQAGLEEVFPFDSVRRYTDSGSWGFWEDMFTPTAKFRALERFRRVQ